MMAFVTKMKLPDVQMIQRVITTLQLLMTTTHVLTPKQTEIVISIV